MQTGMIVLAAFLLVLAGSTGETEGDEHLYANSLRSIAGPETIHAVLRANDTITMARILGGSLDGHAGVEIAQGHSSSRRIFEFKDSGSHDRVNTSSLPIDCKNVFAQSCIEGVLDRARQEAERIGNPALPGEEEVIGKITDAIVRAREASERTEGSWTEDFFVAASIEAVISVSRAFTLAWVANAFVEAGSPKKGNRMVPLIIEAWNKFVSADIAQQDLEDFSLLSYVAAGQADLGFFEDALRTADYIQSSEERSSLLRGIAEEQAEAGNIREALATARRIIVPEKQDSAYASIAETQARAGFIREALATVLRISVPEKKGSAYASIANTRAKTGDISEARQIVELIDDDYLKAEALLELAVAKPDLVPFAESIRVGERIAHKPTRDELFSDIAVAHVQAGRADSGIETLRRVHDESLKGWALFRIAAAQAKMGHAAEALESYDAAGTLANGLDESQRRSLRQNVIFGLIEGGLFQQAIGLTQQLKDLAQRAWVLAKIARAQADAGRFDGALNTASLISAGPTQDNASDTQPGLVQGAGEKATALASIAEKQASAGKRLDARETFDKAILAAELLGEAGSYFSGTAHGERLRLIVQAQAQSGLFEDAFRTALLIDEEPSRSEAFRDLAKEEAAAGLIDGAVSAVRHIAAGSAKSEALREIAAAQIKMELREKARQTLLAARRSAQSDTGARDYGNELLAVAMMQSDFGFAEDARSTFALAARIADKVENELDNTDSLMLSLTSCSGKILFGTFSVGLGGGLIDLFDVAWAQAKAGLLNDALETTYRMDFASTRACFLIAVAEGLAEH